MASALRAVWRALLWPIRTPVELWNMTRSIGVAEYEAVIAERERLRQYAEANKAVTPRMVLNELLKNNAAKQEQTLGYVKASEQEGARVVAKHLSTAAASAGSGVAHRNGQAS
ncbi:Uncharacterized protein PBTT_04140 [Plasmodiophora brassicae]